GAAGPDGSVRGSEEAAPGKPFGERDDLLEEHLRVLDDPAFCNRAQKPRQISRGRADALGPLEAPILARPGPSRRPREFRDVPAGHTARPEARLAEAGGNDDLALDEIEERSAARALGGDGEEGVALVGVRERSLGAARLRE